MEGQHPAGSFLAAVRRYLDSGNRSLELNFVRGVAILLVIGFHAMGQETPYPFFRGLEATLKAVGWSGVDLFFVLSGFLVGGVLLSECNKTEALDVKRFIIHRSLKIWPAYYCYLLPAQPVVATPCNQLIRQCFRPRIHQDNRTESEPNQGFCFI
jgi:peptidoglycan/LPS O-acetylase OafA/YrhL